MRNEKEIEAKIEELTERARKKKGYKDSIIYWNIQGKLAALEWVRGKEERI